MPVYPGALRVAVGGVVIIVVFFAVPSRPL
jgi:hypothetical protein